MRAIGVTDWAREKLGTRQVPSVLGTMGVSRNGLDQQFSTGTRDSFHRDCVLAPVLQILYYDSQ